MPSGPRESKKRWVRFAGCADGAWLTVELASERSHHCESQRIATLESFGSDYLDARVLCTTVHGLIGHRVDDGGDITDIVM